MLNNTPSSDGAPVEQSNTNNSSSAVNHRAGTRAAMIGLAISMGATSLLVTRQSDQAQAAAPVGSQKAASSTPAVPDTEMKFAPTKLETQTASLLSVPENPVIVEPTAISQVPGLEAKLQVTASGISVPVPASEATAKSTTYKSSFYQQPQLAEGLQAANKIKQLQKLSIANSVVTSPTTSLTPLATENQAAQSEVTAQLKAQQEFALNRLQEKSNRLKQSLAELRSEETQNSSKANTELAPIPSVVEKAPQLNASKITTEQTLTNTNADKASLISRLKQAKASTPNTADTASTATTPSVVTPVPATIKTAAPTSAVSYEVKPGDTLAAIANKYGTSVSELAKANHLNNPNQLQISQKLVVPAAKLEHSTANQSTVAVNPTVEQADVTATVAPSPVNTPVVTPTVAATPQLPVVNNSSVTLPTPVTEETQTQTNTVVSQPDSKPANSYGMGGDAPVPKVFVEMQSNKKPQKLASTKSNERLQSLQAEIQRLREKYRAQQAGVVTPVVSENKNPAAVSVPVLNPSNFAVSSPTTPRNSVQIPVPAPIGTTNYTAQPIRPVYRATQPTEPVNPEFLPNQNPGRKTPVTRIATPPRGVNASDSLGKMRGTTVSPSGLPALSAVDRYLPKPIDEAIPPPSTSTAAYIWPAKGVLTSGYGWRWGRMHKGIDVANSTGTPIYSSADGVVAKAGWNNGGYGNLVEIRHADGSMTRYAHNSKIFVQVGQQVRQGETIAAMGSTGFSTGPHTHFEIHPPGKGAVNPIALLASRI
ncbi:peptidoglycan DD-metalloendopeptidase family protein [Tolypothrix sp. FACHB-123]|uniref:peptidoglycan DD-metalloendopeptidase family protein n=1 Tax=Tolypothrix sp. FACHB-123 TaxID=2692868 RepID=UPI00280A7F24|nr:peptidoglycan DD-metalloendopeptidase family protein [Tolypothrix sp. FACHB-123]